MSSEQTNSNSASHWCKTVVEAVVPKANLMPIVPPPPPVKNPTNNSSKSTTPTNLSNVNFTNSLNNQTINSQYLNLYQQMYSTKASNGSTTITSNNSNPLQTAATYANIVSNGTSNPVSGVNSLSKPISAPWGNAYSYQSISNITTINKPVQVPLYHSTIPNPLTTAGNIQNPSLIIKKPNPSRFSSIVSDTVNNTASSSTSTIAGTATRTTNSGQPESLKLFVQRSFASCTTDVEREYVSNQLKAMITNVTSDGRLHVHKWELEPIPKYDPLLINKNQTNDIKSSYSYNSNNIVSNNKAAVSQSGIYGPASTEKNNNIQESKKKKRDTKTVGDNINVDNDSPPLKKSVLAGLDKLNTQQEIKMREMRQSRFKYDEQMNTSSLVNTTSNVLTASRTTKKNKHHNNSNINSMNNNSSNEMTEFEMESLKIVGTCTKLEKDYLRLTSAPHPNVVRPEHILRKSIQLIKNKWATDEVDYVYMCSQLKSLRQDLTVQHIQNDFTVHVYETHARVALECDDMNEYNQCQTQLKQLYSLGYKGSEMEFVAYRILYYVYLLGNKKYTGGSSDLAHLMTSLSIEAYQNPAVIHALNIREAIQLENYNKFFKLYKETPNMGNYILDLMIDNWRVQALQKICRGYKPDVSIEFIITILAFDNINIGIEFMKKIGCILIDNDMKLNTKDTIIDGSLLQTETKLLL